MRSAMEDVLPAKLRRGLRKFGEDIGIARRKRRLTVAMMAERVGVAESTYLRAEKGDPKVAFGVYAMVLFVLGFGDAIAELIDARKDDQGLLLDVERMPKRIRAKKNPTPL
ncbi:MAG: helix-turn-helix transcriptional regulator [Deltaproteobacteria bacterium]|nr:helix-turn-helix transcriptional regulator [Deltaproteobacteria bacterium]